MLLVWAFNKSSKTFKLCGDYSQMFSSLAKKGENNEVHLSDCNYTLDKSVIENHFSHLAFNPFKDYKFMVNKEKYERFYCLKWLFADNWNISVVNIDDDKKIIGNIFRSNSNSSEINVLEALFDSIGYESIYGRYKFYSTEIKELEKEGYKLVLWYGAAKTNALFVREKGYKNA